MIITFSAVLSGWTSILLLTNTTFNSEINDVLHKMYLNQKNFIFNVKDLSLILVKDANQRFSANYQDITLSSNMQKDIKN